MAEDPLCDQVHASMIVVVFTVKRIVEVVSGLVPGIQWMSTWLLQIQFATGEQNGIADGFRVKTSP